MELDSIYQNVGPKNVKDTSGAQTLNHSQDEGKDRKHRGSRCLVLMAVCLGLICVLLLIFITLQHITITAERDELKSYKKTTEEFNQTINNLQDNYTDVTQKKLELETRVKDLIFEKDQLQNSFNSLSQKKLELETRVKDLTAEKDQLQRNFNSLNQKKLELESKVSLTEGLMREQGFFFFIIHELKSWSESRQYCRDRGADLVIIKTEEKQRFITSVFKERVWIGLTDIENEGRMIWVDNSPLNRGFWFKGEPNNYEVDEDCVELNPTKDSVNNWNDESCSLKRKGICEKN